MLVETACSPPPWRCARLRFGSALAFASWLAQAAPLPAAAPSVGLALQLRVGINQPLNTGQAQELGLELDLAPGRYGLYPAIGAVRADDGSAHLYLCLARDFRFGRRWSATAFTGVAAYDPGRDGLELGGTALYRSGVALAARVNERLSASVALYHLSNARLRKPNPGSESLTIGLRWSPD